MESQTTDLNASGSNFARDEQQKYQLGYFSPAFTIGKENGNFHEFELSRFLINHEQEKTIITYDSLNRKELVSGERNTKLFFALRYEYNIALRKVAAEAKLQPYIGFSFRPYFERSMFTPLISSQFPTRENQLGVNFSIVPRINYNLKGNWYLDLNVPLQLTETNVNSLIRENPALPGEQRKTTTINFETLPLHLFLRFGVGLRL